MKMSRVEGKTVLSASLFKSSKNILACTS